MLYGGYQPKQKRPENMAVYEECVKSLEQQPSDDCVSRAELLKKYEDRFIELQKVHQQDKQLGINWCINTLKDMPPVTPTRKSGLHWIERFNNEDKWLECPYCHKDSDNAYNYCPNCGTEMVGGENG